MTSGPYHLTERENRNNIPNQRRWLRKAYLKITREWYRSGFVLISRVNTKIININYKIVF